MKGVLRKEILKLRDEIPWEDVEKKSHIITAKILTLPEVITSTTIFTYVSFKKEVITHQLIETLLTSGKNVLVPKVYKVNRIMCACKIRDLNELKPGVFGILEPVNCDNSYNHIDCAIIPGVAFDIYGARIGYGGGYYDRFLEKHKDILKIAPCFDLQLLPKIPAEKHDIPMDLIITESKIIYTKNDLYMKSI